MGTAGPETLQAIWNNMPEAIIRFSRCIQDSQDYGSDDEHMVSRVFFRLQTDAELFPDLMCDVRQTVGEAFETAPLEVGQPIGYDGSLDYTLFRQAVEDYYRSSFGSRGEAIQIEDGSNIRTMNTLVAQETEVRISYTEDSEPL
jgi:hypothetical protein